MRLVDLKDCPEHIPQLAGWHHAQWSHFKPEQTLEQRIEKMQRYLGDGIIPRTWVAIDDDGSVLGSAALVEHDLQDRDDLSPWLASVYVNASKRGQGVGRQLVRHVMDQARGADFKKLYLFTPDRAHFYAHMGWTELERRHYHGEDISVMEYTFN